MGSRDVHAAGPLSVDARSLDFGRVPLQPDFRWTLGIENTSARTVSVRRFDFSCACTSVSPSSLTLGPRERGTVEVAIDLTKADIPSRPLPLGDADFSVSISPVIGDDDNPLGSWTVRGNVVKSLDISEPELRFGDVLRADTTSPRSVRITAGRGIARLAATSGNKEVVIGLDEGPRSSERSLRVAIRSSPALGQRAAMIRVEGEADDGTPLRGYVKTHWNVMEDVAIRPASLIDVARKRGDVFRERVVLSSRTNTKIRIASFKADSPAVKVRPVERPESQDLEFEIETTIDAVGEVRHSVRFDVALGDSVNSYDQVTLPILGFGLAD
jgi:hypothetical protein